MKEQLVLEDVDIVIKHRRKRIILLLLIVITVCILVYPSWADAVSDYKQTIIISGYADDYNSLSEEEIFSMKQAAQEYNHLVWIDQQYKPFHYEGEEYEDPLYDSILKVSPLSTVMAYIDIPRTGAYIPIVHGTKSDDLAYQAGHMHGTSVPIGGENTHSVISAHTGLRSAELFTGIDKLVQGDVIYIHVLNEIHIYTVREINVVLPKDADGYLQIEEGRDLITLYTCTPYGINSHRLLVKCEHTGDMDVANESGWLSADNRNLWALIRAILWSILPLAILVGGLIMIYTKKGRRIMDKLFHVTAAKKIVQESTGDSESNT